MPATYRRLAEWRLAPRLFSGHTPEAHRHDLRGFSQWAADNGVDALGATRPHIELFRARMEERGLAAPTIDRRLSTVCGFSCPRSHPMLIGHQGGAVASATTSGADGTAFEPNMRSEIVGDLARPSPT